MRFPARAKIAIAGSAMVIAIAGCGGDDSTTSSEPTGAGGDADAVALFDSAGCAGCHTLAAANADGAVGPQLDGLNLSADQVEDMIRNGGSGMPSFAGDLSEEEIAKLSDFVSQASQ